jgi:hypothetical protein
MELGPLNGRCSDTNVSLTTDSLRSAKLRRSLANQINHPFLVNGRNNRHEIAVSIGLLTHGNGGIAYPGCRALVVVI